jgi:hypothetical protein
MLDEWGVFLRASKEILRTVFIDTFIDCDIGYYPRIGLLDRRFSPGPALIGIQLSSVAKRRAFEQFNLGKAAF